VTLRVLGRSEEAETELVTAHGELNAALDPEHESAEPGEGHATKATGFGRRA
jgi:hypothetical protein